MTGDVHEQNLRDNAHNDGVRSAVAWHRRSLDRLQRRLEICLPGELGALQGEVKVHRCFLKIFGLE